MNIPSSYPLCAHSHHFSNHNHHPLILTLNIANISIPPRDSQSSNPSTQLATISVSHPIGLEPPSSRDKNDHVPPWPDTPLLFNSHKTTANTSRGDHPRLHSFLHHHFGRSPSFQPLNALDRHLYRKAPEPDIEDLNGRAGGELGGDVSPSRENVRCYLFIRERET